MLQGKSAFRLGNNFITTLPMSQKELFGFVIDARIILTLNGMIPSSQFLSSMAKLYTSNKLSSIVNTCHLGHHIKVFQYLQ
jgi:hypothetical protein